jgi:ferric-dicitrate binding protein FerR (iron transport regulator)
MVPEHIENNIVKYLNSEATHIEMEELESWLKDDNNLEVFKDYIKVNYLIDINTVSFDNSEVLIALEREMQKSKIVSLRQSTRKLWRYAAVFVILIASTWGIYQFSFNTAASNEQPLNEVVLKSENGSINILNQSGNTQITDRDGEVVFKKIGNTLVTEHSAESQKLVYNTLTVPYGRQFSLELSDGTKVQLNAGTSLRFPEHFIKGKNRQVYIEYGEAFFEVAKDPDHPFIVNNNGLDITVLGTQFNVSAYPEDDAMTTVLVEGSVQLTASSNASQSTVLKPGYKAIWTDEKPKFEVTKADIELHTGWRTGKIFMKSLPFSKMIKKLERHYNVIINSNDEKLNNEVITATFDEEGIEDVLKLINKIHPITYNISGRTINIFNK